MVAIPVRVGDIGTGLFCQLCICTLKSSISMKSELTFVRTLSLFALIVNFLPAPYSQAAEFKIIDIGTLGGQSCWPTSISQAGHVTGRSTTPSGAEHAFLYFGGMTDLTPSGATFSSGNSVNSMGQVSGTLVLRNQYRAFLFDGSLHDLGLGDGYGTHGGGINELGVSVGAIQQSDGNFRAFRYDGSLHDLGKLSEGASAGSDINFAGVIAGYSSPLGSTSTIHAIRYDGAFHDLGTLGQGFYSRSSAINDDGLIAGYSMTFGFNFDSRHGFLYNGALIDLGTLGGSFSEATGLNNFGHVVGSSSDAMGEPRAFLFKDGTMADLNALIDPGSGWQLLSASDLNDAGQIVGVGLKNGQERGFLLTPVPEPNGTIMGILTLTAIAQSRRFHL